MFSLWLNIDYFSVIRHPSFCLCPVHNHYGLSVYNEREEHPDFADGAGVSRGLGFSSRDVSRIHRCCLLVPVQFQKLRRSDTAEYRTLDRFRFSNSVCLSISTAAETGN